MSEHRTNENSVESHSEWEASEQAQSWRQKIFDYLSVRTTPHTRRQVQEALKATQTQVQPEFTKLTGAGVLERCGKVKCEYTGRTVDLFKATGKPLPSAVDYKAKYSGCVDLVKQIARMKIEGEWYDSNGNLVPPGTEGATEYSDPSTDDEIGALYNLIYAARVITS